jgi:hypothetical protein
MLHTKTKKLSAIVSPATAAIYDLLSDSKSHNMEDVLNAASESMLKNDFYRCIVKGKAARHNRDATTLEYANSGARAIARNNIMIASRNGKILVDENTDASEQVSMPSEFITQWKEKKRAAALVLNPQGVQEWGKITYYAGISEYEGWAHAPLITKDVVHVRPATSLDVNLVKKAFTGWEVSESPEGLITISALPIAPLASGSEKQGLTNVEGYSVKKIVSDWFADNNIYHEGVRDAKGVRRRELGRLPRPFFEDMVRVSYSYVRGLVASRHGAAMQKLVRDNDDIDGYVAQWVLELASSFNADLGRPFGTWLTTQVPRKVQDLSRAEFGRTAADAQIRQARAQAEFEARHGRTPTTREIMALSLEMGFLAKKGRKPTEEELETLLVAKNKELRANRKNLNTLQNLRTTTTINVGPDQPEIAVEDLSPKPEDLALSREKSQQITLALLAASGQLAEGEDLPKITMPLGFLVTYLMHWDDWVKGDLIFLAGCADRKVTEELEKVNLQLSKTLKEYRGEEW